MKIAVDLTFIEGCFTSGVATYAFRLLQGFREAGARDSIILLVDERFADGYRHLIDDFRMIPFKSRHLPLLPLSRGPLSCRSLDKLVKREGIQALISPYICDRNLHANSIPCIGVVHDTSQFYQNNPIFRFRYRIGTIASCNRLKAIVAISDNTRESLRLLPAIQTPVTVIHNSVISSANPSLKKVCEPPYILNVNTLLEYKNPLTLVRAFERIKDRIPHRLLFKGARTSYWNQQVEPYLKRHHLEGRVQLDDTQSSQEEIAGLFVNADLFVSPSEMEGFGYTPIEAALAGVPVICNELPALMESTMGLATYYSPSRDDAALAEKILFVLGNRDRIDVEGIRAKYAEKYSPHRQARAFISLIESITCESF